MNCLIKVWREKSRLCLFAAMVTLAGCAGTPDITSTEKSPDKPYSNDEIRQMTMDHPQFISGDYFRKREQTSAKTIGKASTEDNKTGKEQAVNAQPAKGSTTVIAAASTTSSVAEGKKIKVALLIDRRQVQANYAGLLNDSAHTNVAKFPVVHITPKEIDDSLSRYKANDTNDLDSMSRKLSVYPGVRMLILIEEFQLPATYPGSARAVLHLIDAGILHRYPPLETTLLLAAEVDAAFFADTVVNTAFENAVDRSTIMPWFCRAFSHEEQVWYVNAGKDSGLQVGKLLKVVTGGKLVKAPSGIPAGWIPGDPKGTLRVDRHFGRDLAACSLVEGFGPEDGDLLMK